MLKTFGVLVGIVIILGIANQDGGTERIRDSADSGSETAVIIVEESGDFIEGFMGAIPDLGPSTTAPAPRVPLHPLPGSPE